MHPATVFAGMVGLLSLALLAAGFVVPALLAAVFAVLIFASRRMSSGRKSHDGDAYLPGIGSTSSSGNDCRNDSDHHRDASDRCDGRDSDSDSSNDCDAGGDSGGDSGGGDSGGSD